MIGQIGSFFIPHDPDRQVRVHIVEPGLEALRVRGMAKHPGRDHRAACGIMPAVRAIGVWHTAGCIAIPGQVRPVLPERTPETDVGGADAAALLRSQPAKATLPKMGGSKRGFTDV